MCVCVCVMCVCVSVCVSVCVCVCGVCVCGVLHASLTPLPPPISLRGDRYDALRICIGQDMIQRLADLKLFMVSSGLFWSVLVGFAASLLR